MYRRRKHEWRTIRQKYRQIKAEHAFMFRVRNIRIEDVETFQLKVNGERVCPGQALYMYTKYTMIHYKHFIKNEKLIYLFKYINKLLFDV